MAEASTERFDIWALQRMRARVKCTVSLGRFCVAALTDPACRECFEKAKAKETENATIR